MTFCDDMMSVTIPCLNLIAVATKCENFSSYWNTYHAIKIVNYFQIIKVLIGLRMRSLVCTFVVRKSRQTCFLTSRPIHTLFLNNIDLYSCKRHRSRSAGFPRSQLIRNQVVFCTMYEFIINQNMKYSIGVKLSLKLSQDKYIEISYLSWMK